MAMASGISWRMVFVNESHFRIPFPNPNPNQMVLPNSKFVIKSSPQFPCGLNSRPTFTPCAAVASSAPDTTSLKVKDETTHKYYFVVANAKFMLDEEEHFKELMYERLRLFRERNMEQDFWLLVEPKFLDQFPNITKRLKRPSVALVSTNRPWITYMKLRLDRVLSESYEAESIEEALASNPVKLEFEKPENWAAPYEKYEYGWWETFLPGGSEKAEA